MRINGTIYDTISKLPPGSLPVSSFAREYNMQVGHVYTKYKRFVSGVSKNNPHYVIRCFLGSNYVIPSKELTSIK